MGRYRVITLPRADKDIEDYKKSGNKIALSRIERIFVELELHPQIGIGKPEMLKHDYSGFWSREINKKNRIIYEIKETEVIVKVISAKGHYGDK